MINGLSGFWVKLNCLSIIGTKLSIVSCGRVWKFWKLRILLNFSSLWNNFVLPAVVRNSNENPYIFIIRQWKFNSFLLFFLQSIALESFFLFFCLWNFEFWWKLLPSEIPCRSPPLLRTNSGMDQFGVQSTKHLHPVMLTCR